MIRALPWEDSKSESMEKELNQLCYDLRVILGETVEVKWEIVKEIERSSSGKFRWIVSEVSRKMGWYGVAE
jgi:phenylacetate-coenzyme A ligase PaaK-like adenylate-forming protein